ncbi:permease of the major facilitator superfamily [Coniochaeta sp. 2T2.1]|nr:permease of the major facilitator superfamily [Coniochaeta sp. 2T2.1]
MEEEQKLPPGTKGGVLGATHEVVTFDPALSRRIARKFDYRILSVFLLINLFSFIDRVNIGNARLLGLSTDLGLGIGLRYNIALMCLFVSYCVVELPANIVCKKIGGHIWIPFLVVSFGLVTMLTAVVQSHNGLYVVRFILGCLEGGISPGLVFMLAQFYRRSELGFRTSIYISAASASGAFGGLLAIGFSQIPRWGMIHTWRNIFFFEGLISILLGIAAFFLIPAGPTEAKFLSPEEKVVAVDRLRLDSAGTTEHAKTSMKHVLIALCSPHTLGCGLGFFFGNTTAQSFSVFSPSIIKAMGYTNTKAQLLSVGPYVVACIISIIVGWLSDRFKKRAVLIICSVPLGIAGFFMLEFLPASRPWAKYGALYLAASGLYAFLPLWLAWAMNNSATPTVRASASGIVFTMGSLGGIIAPWTYLPGDAPQYRTGHAVMLSFLCASWACAVALYFYSKWENKQRDMGKRDYRLAGLTKEQELELSSNHPAFRYFL